MKFKLEVTVAGGVVSTFEVSGYSLTDGILLMNTHNGGDTVTYPVHIQVIPLSEISDIHINEIK